MKPIKLLRYNYTILEHRDDVTQMLLRYNLFGMNGKMYANLGSLDLKSGTEQYETYLKNFSSEELRYSIRNCLYELKIHTRTFDDEYETLESMDFIELYEFIKKNGHKFQTVYCNFDDNSTVSLPLGSKILFDASNYAALSIERIKYQNFENNFEDSEHVSNFIKAL